jgi:mannose-1-phosphate guanylyltransferase
MYAVILAGGGGTRLWPMSRPETPKPFLPLLGERSLLQRTVDRLVGGPELSLAPGDVWVVTDRRYAGLVREQLPETPILIEPAGRNTAAAVALATLRIERDPDEVMLVLAADHHIVDETAFRHVLAAAALVAEGEAAGTLGVDAPLVTLGVRPDRPATDYGYLVADPVQRTRVGDVEAVLLRGFEEKPPRDRAVELLGDPATSWNAGIFAWRRSAIRAALHRYTGLVTLLDPVRVSDTGLASAYDVLKPLSVDRAVLEGAAGDRRVAMVVLGGGWSDLGGWTAILAAIGARGSGRVVSPGETVEARPDDLVVERSDGRLVLSAGPRSIHSTSPTALLSGAAASRTEVDTLLRRVTEWEVRR